MLKNDPYARQWRRLSKFHLSRIRHILGISWQDRSSNANVLCRAGLKFPVCTLCLDTADSDGWVMFAVMEAGRIPNFPPGFLLLRKAEPLPELSPQTPVSGYSWPRRTHMWRIRLSLHLVLGLPCRLVHSRGVLSVTLFVHLLSLNRAMCPAHPRIPFLITYMISCTPVWCRIQVLRVWYRRVMPSMMHSILRCATDSSSM